MDVAKSIHGAVVERSREPRTALVERKRRKAGVEDRLKLIQRDVPCNRKKARPRRARYSDPAEIRTRFTGLPLKSHPDYRSHDHDTPWKRTADTLHETRNVPRSFHDASTVLPDLNTAILFDI
ncbi:unnamed protein product [Xylocopa violacea]|uniref:Uncharacterized protein n=1 Tax=Xylocopa violacea TaxID=135666 RepID=A0ABP1P1A5_XYLVO